MFHFSELTSTLSKAKAETFIITNANSLQSLTASTTKDVPDYLVHTLIVQTQYQFLFVHSCNGPKSETNFWKQCIMTEKGNTAMPPNVYPPQKKKKKKKIVQSSVMQYHNLNVIRKFSKNLLTIKCEGKKITPNTCTHLHTHVHNTCRPTIVLTFFP